MNTETLLKSILIISFGGAFLTYISGKLSKVLRDIFAVLTAIAITVIAILLYGKTGNFIYAKNFLGFSLTININSLSWIFLITLSVVSSLSVIFSLSYIKGHERTDFYYLMLLLVNAGMACVVLSADMISFYVFWEVMSWATFLLISYNKGKAVQAGLKYIIMSVVGSLSMLVAILLIYTHFGSLTISQFTNSLREAPHGFVLLLLILFSITFGIKNAVMPLHAWLPDAHSEAPSPFSAVLSGVLIKMGTYGFVLIMYSIVGLKVLLSIGSGIGSYHSILAILGAITIIFPSFIAFLQDDAKRLLAWSSIAQVGYIIIGISFGTNMAFIGGLFHFFNHAIFKALLFLGVGAVEYRVKTRNLNELGGLIKKMPLTFTVILIGASALIGLPLTNGFVSKWIIYKALIGGNAPFMAFAALLGTWGTILYSYKLIHNIFLGQLSERHETIKEAPFNMHFSMILLAIGVVVFGILPGIPLKLINNIAVALGYKAIDITLWGIKSEAGMLNIVNILAAVIVSGLVVWLISAFGGKSVSVRQDNNYAAGSYIPKEKYNYTVDFYKPLTRMLSPVLKDIANDFYIALGRGSSAIGNGVRKIYTGDIGYYVIYIILFLAILILIKVGFKL